jgi:orotidine-5'-phosphate decarboxylase
VIIVGRGIYAADDPVEAAKIYQEAGFNAYKARLEQ